MILIFYFSWAISLEDDGFERLKMLFFLYLKCRVQVDNTTVFYKPCGRGKIDIKLKHF